MIYIYCCGVNFFEICTFVILCVVYLLSVLVICGLRLIRFFSELGRCWVDLNFKFFRTCFQHYFNFGRCGTLYTLIWLYTLIYYFVDLFTILCLWYIFRLYVFDLYTLCCNLVFLNFWCIKVMIVLHFIVVVLVLDLYLFCIYNIN